ncbi:hypothetical protein OCH7691_00395 [Oceanibacterium hippocampi]|uniref:Uncharacterized protein n=1 Tax=Oceanibacterium hippocampi TaxID=745714 RepID=A0A1Y5RJ26_9PROT|nr:hypothetical protein OCH7691_00395 [Oceanibacterium hippocampi]
MNGFGAGPGRETAGEGHQRTARAIRELLLYVRIDARAADFRELADRIDFAVAAADEAVRKAEGGDKGRS